MHKLIDNFIKTIKIITIKPASMKIINHEINNLIKKEKMLGNKPNF